jgi:hypothetical protein
MSEPIIIATPPPADNSKFDETLLIAWERFIHYDSNANNTKKSFKLWRYGVIILTFLGAVGFSVVLWATASPNPSFLGVSQETIRNFGVILLTLPLVASAVMNVALRHYSSITWVQYRYIAEKLRHNIYLYRTHAGIYEKNDKNQRDNELSAQISAINGMAGLIGTKKSDDLYSKQLKDGKLNRKDLLEARKKFIEEQLKKDFQGESIFGELSFDDYVAIRLTKQRIWYSKRVNNDYSNAKWTNIIIVILTTTISISGLLLTNGDVMWIGWIAFINAVSVVLNSLSSVNLFGKTYGIYGRAKTALENIETDITAKEDDNIAKDVRERDFVDKIEAILVKELEEWYQVASEAQVLGDEALIQNISNLQTDSSQPIDLRINKIVAEAQGMNEKQLSEIVEEMKKLKEEIKTTRNAP